MASKANPGCIRKWNKVWHYTLLIYLLGPNAVMPFQKKLKHDFENKKFVSTYRLKILQNCNDMRRIKELTIWQSSRNNWKHFNNFPRLALFTNIWTSGWNYRLLIPISGRAAEFDRCKHNWSENFCQVNSWF